MVVAETIKEILSVIDSYENNTMENNIRQRLELNLRTYLEDLNQSYQVLKEKSDNKQVIKELSK